MRTVSEPRRQGEWKQVRTSAPRSPAGGKRKRARAPSDCQRYPKRRSSISSNKIIRFFPVHSGSAVSAAGALLNFDPGLGRAGELILPRRDSHTSRLDIGISSPCRGSSADPPDRRPSSSVVLVFIAFRGTYKRKSFLCVGSFSLPYYLPLMLVCARLRYVAGTQWGGKKYMNTKLKNS